MSPLAILLAFLPVFLLVAGGLKVPVAPGFFASNCPTLAPMTTIAPIICSNTSNFEGEIALSTSGAAIVSASNISISFSFYYNNTDCSVANPQNFIFYNLITYIPFICSSSGTIIVPVTLANQTINAVPSDTSVTVGPFNVALNVTALCPGGILSLVPMSEILFTGYAASSAANTFIQGSFAVNITSAGIMMPLLSATGSIGATATYDLSCGQNNIICPNGTNGDYDFQFCPNGTVISSLDTVQFGFQFTSSQNNAEVDFYQLQVLIEFNCSGKVVFLPVSLTNQRYTNVAANTITPATVVYQSDPVNASTIAALCPNGSISYASPAEVIVTESIAASNSGSLINGIYHLLITGADGNVANVSGPFGPKLVYPLGCVTLDTVIPNVFVASAVSGMTGMANAQQIFVAASDAQINNVIRVVSMKQTISTRQNVFLLLAGIVAATAFAGIVSMIIILRQRKSAVVSSL